MNTKNTFHQYTLAKKNPVIELPHITKTFSCFKTLLVLKPILFLETARLRKNLQTLELQIVMEKFILFNLKRLKSIFCK